MVVGSLAALATGSFDAGEAGVARDDESAAPSVVDVAAFFAGAFDLRSASAGAALCAGAFDDTAGFDGSTGAACFNGGAAGALAIDGGTDAGAFAAVGAGVDAGVDATVSGALLEGGPKNTYPSTASTTATSRLAPTSDAVDVLFATGRLPPTR